MGGLILLLLSHSLGRPHLFLLFGSFAGRAIPAHPQRSRVLGKQLGRAMGAGEPLKHEEPVAGVRRGQLLFWCRNRGSLGEWTWKISCFPSQRAERGPEFPVWGQLAPASLSKSIFLTTSIDVPKPPRMEKCSLSSWAACTYLLAWQGSAILAASERGLFPKPSPPLQDFCASLRKPLGISPQPGCSQPRSAALHARPAAGGLTDRSGKRAGAREGAGGK